MKKFLISLVILTYGGAALSFVLNYDNVLYRNWISSNWIAMVFIIALNALCAIYLYEKVATRKAEWGLFGFLGNLQALFIYWIWKHALNRWKQSEHFFSK